MKLASLAVLLPTLIAPAVAQDQQRWVRDPQSLRCTPTELADGGVLQLDLGRSHGKELAIRRRSDGAFFFLVVANPPSDMKPLMSTSSFERAKEVLIPSTLVANEWREGALPERVFAVPGFYDLLASDNLESELGGAICTIRYAPS